MRVKAVWTVTAGVVPDTPIPELTRGWEYTSEDYDSDIAHGMAEAPNYSKCLKDATEYAASLQQPAYVNWVRLEFMWL